MPLRVAIGFMFLFAVLHSQAQSDSLGKKTIAETSTKTFGTNAGTPTTPVNQKLALLDVLIATNEDCVLLLNDQEKKPVSKNAFLYLKLAPGLYRYSAKSQTTGYVYVDTFSVSVGRLNEVFIDLLYAMDVEKEQRAKQASDSAAALVVNQQNNVGVNQPLTGATNNTQKSKELPAINALLASMTPINGGNFIMGNNRSPAADEAEHKVLLNPFLISKYEVTQDQWERIMGSNPSLNKACPSCPVENVSWEEVMVFLRRLNSLSGKKFRLPTEAEWEYVTRLGGKAELDQAGGTEEYIKRTAWNGTDAESKTHPVGTKQPNVAGVYDLLGNVSEWCADWYGAFFYKEDYTDKNPEGPPLGKEKVVRGGNFKDYLGDRFRPSVRNKLNPKTKAPEVGFRLVLEQSPL